MRDSARRWQGAWVVRDADYPGSVQAWGIAADSVTVYDAGRRRTERQRFSIISPCRLERSRSLPDGTELTTSETFVFSGDGLHVAQAPANGGIRDANRVIACIANEVYVYTAQNGECWRWDAKMSGPRMPSHAECSIANNGIVSSFVVQPFEGGDPVRIDFYGDALLSQSLLAHVAERRPAFDDAVRRAEGLRR